MIIYIVRRLVQMVPVLVLVTMISFGLIYVLPGDPALLMLGDQQATNHEAYEALRGQLGLDRPLPLQYLDWVSKTVRGDLGTSIRDKQPVLDGFIERLPVTVELAILGMVLALVVALPSGIVSALHPNSRLDIIASVTSFAGIAMPSFWLGILLIYAFAVTAKVLPPSGFVPITTDPRQNFIRMLLPAVTLGLGLAALLMRQVRSSMLETLQQEYVVTAHAKGLRPRAVILGHALKNGLIPIVTILGLQIGHLFGGAVIIETIFSLPGVGRWAVDSILARDFPVVQAVCLLLATTVLISSLIADLAYAYIDPRIRYG